MNIKPLADRVVIEVDKKKETTIGGIIVPNTAKEKPQEGKVVAVGQGGCANNGELIAMEVKVNDVVLYSKYKGEEVKIDGAEYLVIKESDILAIINK